MSSRSRRQTAKRVPTIYFSEEENSDSNNDDSLFVLEDGINAGLDSDEESPCKKKKVSSKSAQVKKKNICQTSKSRKRKNIEEESVDNSIACKSTLDFATNAECKPSSSFIKSENKGKNRVQSKSTAVSENSSKKKIKLESSEVIPALTKIKVERISLPEPVQSKFCDVNPTSESKSRDVKPNVKNLRTEKKSEQSDESAYTDCKANLIHIKLEKNAKHDPDGTVQEPSTSKLKISSKRQTKFKTEVKNEAPDPNLSDEKFENKVFCNQKINCKLGDVEWEVKMLAVKSQINIWVARNVIHMLNDGCTIPFIARYRREKTHGLEADQLRHLKDTVDCIKTLKEKAIKIKQQLQKLGKLSPELERTIDQVQSLDELTYIYAPYKVGSSKSKAEKGRALGLESAAHLILNGNDRLVVNQYIDPSQNGLRNNDEIIENIQNIVADLFSKDEAVLEYLYELENTVIITIKSTKTKVPKGKNDENSKKKTANEDVQGKFEVYYNFETTTKKIQPYQILALNRGESNKILTVKFTISDWLVKKLYSFCERKWLCTGLSYPLRTQMFGNSFNDAYTRLISPLLLRRAKADLNQRAQRAAIESFAVNLKSLLQTPPIKGCSILGIDPGFRHGFKFALIDSSGDHRWTDVFHFDVGDRSSMKNRKNLEVVREKLIAHECELIAIGNGTGCRAIEAIISHFISEKFFQPRLNVRYTIVNERGASIYSCSSLAKEEFSSLDPNLVSAVFIARSLQDPLNEYVKVEPKHLGVGMYQHDVPESRLNSALDEIVSECVSFTGVDVNTASVHLLQRISGLGLVRAQSIIEWRRKYGRFRNREQLTLVNRIGQKTFEQCSGFIRVHGQCDEKDEEKSKPTKAGVNDDINLLDTTWIHPEWYCTAYLFMDKCGVNLQNLGTLPFIDRVKRVIEIEGLEKLATDLNENVERIKLIGDALTRPNDWDYRSQFAKPFFKQGLTEISSLKVGMLMTGIVGNCTDFGAFVDIGVDKNGLIHTSRMNGINVQVGDRVKVKIISIEAERGRIGLHLLNVFE